MSQTKVIFDQESLPIVTDQDLNKYKLEAGVELRELVEQDVEAYDNYTFDDDE